MSATFMSAPFAEAGSSREPPPVAQAPKLRGQHPAPDRGALGRRAPGAVLLDHQPARVVASRKDGEDPAQIQAAVAELGEQALADRRLEIGQRPASERLQDAGVDVLEMD